MESSTRAFIVLLGLVVVAVVLALVFSGGPDVDEPERTPDAAGSRTPREAPPDERPDKPPPIPDRPVPAQRRLEGVVQTADGEPAAGARVLVYASQRKLPEVALAGDEEGRRQVVADLFQFYPDDMKALHPLGMAVTDEEPEVAIAQTVSDDRGAFFFDKLSLSKVRVYAEKETLASKMVTTTSYGRVTLVIEGAAVLDGHVRSADDGRMVGGATVRVLTASRPLTTVTGNDGVFSLSGLPAGPATLFATHPDYAGALKKGLILEAGKATEVTISLTKGYTLTVHVNGEAGQNAEREVPVQGAVVGAYRMEDQGYVLTESGANGIAVFEGLPPGTYLVNADAKGYLPAGEEKVPLQADRKWELLLEKAVMSTVLVVDERDVPIPGAVFWTANIDEEFEAGVSKKVGETNRDGRFSFPFDWDGKQAALFVAKDGYSMGMVQPDDPSEGETMKVKLYAGRVLRGRVTDASGDPIVGAMIYIEATPEDLDEQDLYATLYTGSNGEYRFANLPPGDIWIDVTADGYDGDDAEIEAGGSRREYVKNFRLEKE